MPATSCSCHPCGRRPLNSFSLFLGVNDVLRHSREACPVLRYGGGNPGRFIRGSAALQGASLDSCFRRNGFCPLCLWFLAPFKSPLSDHPRASIYPSFRRKPEYRTVHLRLCGFAGKGCGFLTPPRSVRNDSGCNFLRKPSESPSGLREEA